MRIGEVDTPLEWAVRALRRYHLFDRFLEGAKVLDPTMGQGNLLEAFFVEASERGIPAHTLPLENLYGIERQGEKIRLFLQRIEQNYKVRLNPSQFWAGDLFASDLAMAPARALTTAPSITPAVREPSLSISSAVCASPWGELQVDLLFGNPPWITYAELPDSYKLKIRHLFLHYALIQNRGQVLLGKSRVNLAALMVALALDRYLKRGGEGVFFLPLSLFLGEGAGEGFRREEVQGVPFCITELVELPSTKVFKQVSTLSGLVHLVKGTPQRFPIRVCRLKEVDRGKEQTYEVWHALPIDGKQSPWFFYKEENPFKEGPPQILLPKGSSPRQGINTCGANHLFIFNSLIEQEEGVVRVSNSHLNCSLPKAFLYPLATKDTFREPNPTPHKWILLPYHPNGVSLSIEEIQQVPLLAEYLFKHREALEARKGVLIQDAIRKGRFWALLGVGRYSFYPWKIMWEAVGRKQFSARLLEGKWQANQSLQAFLPFQDRQEAERVCKALQDPQVETYLKAFQTQGTLNWAQPGRMKRLFTCG